MNKITILPGDGIGPEVTIEAVRVLQTIGAIRGFSFEFEEHAIGGVAIRKFGSPLPRNTLDACLASDAVLLGAVGSPEFDRVPPNQRPEAGLLLLRSALGGYANLRPAIAYPSIAACSPSKSLSFPTPTFIQGGHKYDGSPIPEITTNAKSKAVD